MNGRMLELALKKQRLQFRSAMLREQWQAHMSGVEPLFASADGVGAALGWLRRHPQAVVAAGVALLVARPRAVWRWGRRAFVAWQLWRKGRSWMVGDHLRPG